MEPFVAHKHLVSGWAGELTRHDQIQRGSHTWTGSYGGLKPEDVVLNLVAS